MFALLRHMLFFIAVSSLSWASQYFQSPQIYNSGGWDASSLVVADVNGDGKLDLLVGNTCLYSGCTNDNEGIVGVLLGNGDGTFQAAQQYRTGGRYVTSIAVADFNGDHNPDVVVSNGCFSTTDCDTGGLAVLLGNGDGTFQSARSHRSGGQSPTFVLATDLNNDGSQDIVVTNYCKVGEDCQQPPIGKATGNLAVLLGRGDGTFHWPVKYSSGGTIAVSAVATDANHDGNLDLIVANRCGDASCSTGVLGMLLGNGDGTFQRAVRFAKGIEQYSALSAEDVNADGLIDLIVGETWYVRVMLGHDDGTFSDAASYTTNGHTATSVALADVNGDSTPDLLVSSAFQRYGYGPNGLISVFKGNGDGTFGSMSGAFGSAGERPVNAIVRDLNGDHRLDLVVAVLCAAGSHCNNGGAVVFLNASRYPTSITLSSSANPSKLSEHITFTASVTPSGPNSPTGYVRFWDGTKSLGMVLLSDGVAELARGNLAIGSHSIIAQYLGDDTNGKSKPATLEQVVQ